jgi:hypothetical protein
MTVSWPYRCQWQTCWTQRKFCVREVTAAIHVIDSINVCQLHLPDAIEAFSHPPPHPSAPPTTVDVQLLMF